MKTNQYKVTIYTQPNGETRAEIWWYEYKNNPVTGKSEKLFTWWSTKGDLFQVCSDLAKFFHTSDNRIQAFWPLTDTKGKEPVRDKNNQTDFQF